MLCLYKNPSTEKEKHETSYPPPAYFDARASIASSLILTVCILLSSPMQSVAQIQGPVLPSDFKVEVDHLFINGTAYKNGFYSNETFRWIFRTDAAILSNSPRGASLLSNPSVLTFIRAYDPNFNIIWCSGLAGQLGERRTPVAIPGYLPIGNLTQGAITFPITVELVVQFNAVLGGGNGNSIFPPPPGFAEIILDSYVLTDPRNGGGYVQANGTTKGIVGPNLKIFTEGRVWFRVGKTEYPYQNIVLKAESFPSLTPLTPFTDIDDLSVGFRVFTQQIPITDFTAGWPLDFAPTFGYALGPNGQYFVNPMLGYISAIP